jgi:protein-L-isoaspartate(D-aspartate) O-methyltransferase
LRYYNVIFKHADGHFGYAEGGPYEGIIMTAAAGQIPAELTAQLAVGGRMVLPVGVEQQQLYVIDRTEAGLVQTVVHDVRFVPLVPGTV